MSPRLLNLSYEQKNISSSEKFLLSRLAWHADIYDEAWPSIASLVNDLSLTEKTVKKCLLSLINKNLIMKTGKHKGKTKQIPVYFINLNKGG